MIDAPDDECIHGVYPVSSCSICKPKPEPKPEWHWITAKYAGHCSGCNLPIEIGQLIAYARNQPLFHQGCEP